MTLAGFLAFASSLSCPSLYAPILERIEVLADAQSVVYKRCAFADLTFEGKGGAISVARQSKGTWTTSLVIAACCFERCSGHAGGAVFFDGHGFLLVSSVGAECVARDGGALAFASARGGNLDVNLTSAVRTTGGSLDLADGVQVVFTHNTSHCSTGGVVIRKHDSLDFSFAELRAIDMGRCLTLHSNAAAEVVSCLSFCDNAVGALLYVAGTYRVRDTTFRNNHHDVFVVFGPGGALRLTACTLDVRTVSSTQEDAEVHPLVVADVGREPAWPVAGRQAWGGELLNGASESESPSLGFNETDLIEPFESHLPATAFSCSDDSLPSGDFATTDSMPLSDTGADSDQITLSSQVIDSGQVTFSSSEGYPLSEYLALSAVNPVTEEITNSEYVTGSSSLGTALFYSLPPLISDNYTLSGALAISDVGYMESEGLAQSGTHIQSSAIVASLSLHSEVIKPSSALVASSGLPRSRACSESEDGTRSDAINFSQLVELPVTEGLTASQLALRGTIGSSGELDTTLGLSLSDVATFSEPITQSNMVPMSWTRNDTRTVVTQGLTGSGSATVSDFLTRSDSLVVSEGQTFSSGMTFSDWYSASGQYNVSDAVTFSKLGTTSSWLEPSAEGFSVLLNDTKGLLLSDWSRDSLDLKLSVVWGDTGGLNISREASYGFSQLLSSQTVLTAVYLDSASGSLSDPLSASGRATLSDNITFSDIYTNSRVVDLTAGYSCSANISLSDGYTLSNTETESGVPPISVGLSASDPVVTRVLNISELGTESRDYSLSGGLVDSGHATCSRAAALSNDLTFSRDWVVTQNMTESGLPVVSEGQNVSRGYSLSVHPFGSGDLTHSDSELVTLLYTKSEGLTVSVGLNLSAGQTESEGLSGSVRPIVSWVHVVTGPYTRSDWATDSVGPSLSDTLAKSGMLPLSVGPGVSGWLTQSDDFPESGEGTSSVPLVVSVWGTGSNNVTFSDALIVSVVVNATEEGWQSEHLVLTGPLQRTIVQRLSSGLTESQTLLPPLPVAPSAKWSNAFIILLAVLGSLLFLLILASLLWFFLAKRREATYSSGTTSSDGPISSEEEESRESAEAEVEAVVTFDAQPGTSLPDSLMPPSPGPRPPTPAPDTPVSESPSGSYSDAPEPAPPAPPPPVPVPPPDDGSGSSYYSDSAPAPAAAVQSKSAPGSSSSADAPLPPPPAVKPPAPPAPADVPSGSSYSDSETPKPAAPAPPPPPPPATPAPQSAQPADKSDYSYSDSGPAAPPPPPVAGGPPSAPGPPKPDDDASDYSYSESGPSAPPPPAQPQSGGADYYSDTSGDS